MTYYMVVCYIKILHRVFRFKSPSGSYKNKFIGFNKVIFENG
jgi:hypothetical protein